MPEYCYGTVLAACETRVILQVPVQDNSTPNVVEKRNRLSLNSLLESRRDFQLMEWSSWKMVLKAAIMGSPPNSERNKPSGVRSFS